MGRHQKFVNKTKVRRRRIFWFLVFPILVLVGSGVTYGAILVNKTASMMDKSYHEIEGREDGKSALRDKAVNPHTDNISILFIGIDESEKRSQGSATRSDALMLATLNETEKSVKLLSIPRDSYVYIDEVGYKTKINHAHSYGGPKATVETVEQLLDIPIDYYVRLDFEAFMEVVDALGGIEVNVPFELVEQDSQDRKGAIRLQPGLQTLNGEEALALARTRKRDNDIERGKRQQEIMKAILKRGVSAGAITKYPKVIDAIGANMKTNMSFDEMKSLIDYGLSGSLDIESINITGNDMYLRNSKGQEVYYWQLNEQSLANVKSTLKDHLKLAENDKAQKSTGEDKVANP